MDQRSATANAAASTLLNQSKQSQNQTAYVLGCPANATLRYCDRNPPLTVTEGESTIYYTNTFFRNSYGTSLSLSTTHADHYRGTVKPVEMPVTIKCELVGASLTINRGATSAVCSVSSAISGLGMKVSTTVLASTEIVYQPVTVTAGVEKLRAAATATSTGPASTGGVAALPEITAMARLGLGGAALGMFVLANV